jgi:hypothetical protein
VSGLTGPEIVRIVNRYIGVSGGYLGLPERFTYRTHADFYAEYCDLSVDLSPFEGTTRETFMAALESLSPRDQAKMLRGVSERFPPDETGAPNSRPATHAVLLTYIERLESGPLIASQTPQITSGVVLRALQDAENLIRTLVPRVPWTGSTPCSTATSSPSVMEPESPMASVTLWWPSSGSWKRIIPVSLTWVLALRTSRPS